MFVVCVLYMCFCTVCVLFLPYCVCVCVVCLCPIYAPVLCMLCVCIYGMYVMLWINKMCVIVGFVSGSTL